MKTEQSTTPSYLDIPSSELENQIRYNLNSISLVGFPLSMCITCVNFARLYRNLAKHKVRNCYRQIIPLYYRYFKAAWRYIVNEAQPVTVTILTEIKIDASVSSIRMLAKESTVSILITPCRFRLLSDEEDLVLLEN